MIIFTTVKNLHIIIPSIGDWFKRSTVQIKNAILHSHWNADAWELTIAISDGGLWSEFFTYTLVYFQII